MTTLDSSLVAISPLEEIAVNWALIPDALFYTTRSYFLHDKYSSQTFGERCRSIWESRIEKYHKLLLIKQKHGGKIPERVKRLCKKSPCGYTILLLTYFR